MRDVARQRREPGRVPALCAGLLILLAAGGQLGGCAAPGGIAAPPPRPAAPPPRTPPTPLPRPPVEPTGIETTASPTLQAAILRGIGRNEAGRGGSASPRLLAAGPLGKRGTTLTERWIVESNGQRVAYNVDLTPTAPSGTSISIERVGR